jgi:hypothetical protein
MIGDPGEEPPESGANIPVPASQSWQNAGKMLWLSHRRRWESGKLPPIPSAFQYSIFPTTRQDNRCAVAVSVFFTTW